MESVEWGPANYMEMVDVLAAMILEFHSLPVQKSVYSQALDWIEDLVDQELANDLDLECLSEELEIVVNELLSWVA